MSLLSLFIIEYFYMNSKNILKKLTKGEKDNLFGFFEILLTVDMRNRPDRYKKGCVQEPWAINSNGDKITL